MIIIIGTGREADMKKRQQKTSSVFSFF